VGVASELARWLATLDAADLADILARRPEALAAPAPGNLLELADRLDARAAVADAFHLLPEPGVQLVEAMQALIEAVPDGDDSVLRAELAALLGRHDDDSEFDATLHMLAQRALVWPDGPRLRLAAPLRRAFAHPLRLGRPLAALISGKVAADLRRVADRLGRPDRRLKREVTDDLIAWLGDADNVRRVVRAAPARVRDLLHEIAVHGPLVSAERAAYGYSAAFPPDVNWALDRGLLVADGWQLAEMPREVALALRGEDWRAPFTPAPPLPPPRIAIDRDAVRREAAAAAGSALDEVTAVLDQCSQAPPSTLKSGGIGARELRRLAKAVGIGEPVTRLWLELAHSAGLLAVSEREALVTEEYDEWRIAEPAHRLVVLLEAWWELAALPMLEADADDPPRPAALMRDPLGPVAVEVRQVLLRAIADLPAGSSLPDKALGALVHWHAPLATSLLTDVDRVVLALAAEARRVGATGLGTVSELGRALLATDRSGRHGSSGDLAKVLDTARRMLTAPVGTAVFQADLTVVVAGSPSADLSTLLDTCADREARGTASVWRLSPASVRRALDSGLAASALLDELRAAASCAALPQPVEYLVADVARRHGTLRVRAVGCVIRSEDTRLLAELAAVRSLSALRLAALAPTVLASAKAPTETLAALRSAGYAPVGEDTTGAVVLELAPRRRAEASRRHVQTVTHTRRGAHQPVRSANGRTAAGAIAAGAATDDPLVLAKTLLAAPLPDPDRLPDGASGPGAARPGDDPQETIGQRAPQLSRFQVRLLAHALEHGTPVRIEYTNAQGNSSARVIEPLDIDGHLLEAWCHLRDDERVFALDRIESVAPC
jgi:hypothetical protein